MTVKTIVSDAGKTNYERYHFAEATSANGFVFCSGVLGSDAEGKIPADIKDEFRNAWRAVARLLSAAGTGEADIMEITTFHVGLQKHMADFMSVRDEFLSEPWPAWTAIGITELAIAGAHVEIKVTARLPE